MVTASFVATGTSELNLVGGEQWDGQILFGLEPYVLITQNQTLTPHVNNTQENVTIGDVTGYAQFENVDLNTVNLLVDEYNKIISELETEKGIKNRCFDYLCNKGLMNDFYSK